MSKKRVLIHSNNHSAFTGFGKNCKNILKYLYDTGKYELFELANGTIWQEGGSDQFPWGFYGSLPNDQATLASLGSDPAKGRVASYGLLTIDKAIETIKPDVYIGIEDIWAFTETVKKPWWNKINCMIWTTLDSLPILPDAVNLAPNIKNYYVWSSFAENAMKKMGLNHIKTLHGSIDERHFFKYSDQERTSLRKKFGIDEDSFIIGYVFRNQLRKTVGDLIIGFKVFKENAPESNAKLLLHTNWSEGWDIPRLLKENDIDPRDVLTTYHCSSCKNYSVSPFSGQSKACPYCGSKNSMSTTSVANGVSELQLNEVYNLMDMYVHPFTSGGQEIPIQEAKLTELITAVTNYTCGEEMCTAESGGLPLKWSPYREIGTQFLKASTNPIDIAAKITHVFNMSKGERLELGKKARKYILDNYSFKAVGKRLEEIIDAMPEVKFDYSSVSLKPNPDYVPKRNYESQVSFLMDLYKNILAQEVSDSDKGLKYWLGKLSSGASPASIVKYFKQVAKKEISEKFKPKVEDLINLEDKSPRIALVIPNDIYFSLLCGYFITSINLNYPNHKLYIFADKRLHSSFFPYSSMIEKICPIVPNCENQIYMEGSGDHAGFFDICYILDNNQLNLASYSHNVKDKI